MDWVEPAKAWELLGACLNLVGTERVFLDKGLGRILAQEVVSTRDIPSEDRALRDGYALGRLQDPGKPLAVLGQSLAGRPWDQELRGDGAVGVRTGAVVPPGTLGIVPKEEVEEAPDGAWVRLKGEPPLKDSHIGRKGHLVRTGSRLLAPGTKLGPAELSLLAAAGVGQVMVGKRPRVLFLPTGSELVGLSKLLGEGQSFVSHAWYLAWRTEEEGAQGEVHEPVPDLEEEIWGAIQEAVEMAHLVVTTGGTGPSDRDLVCRVLLSHGARVIFRHMPIRPGGTVSAFLVSSTPVIALPGGAGGVGLGCELLLAPSVRTLQGEQDPGPRWIKCTAPRELQRDPVCHRFLEAWLRVEEGMLCAELVPRDFGGGGLVPLRGHGWIHVPPGQGSLEQGEKAGMLLGKCTGRLLQQSQEARGL